MTDSFFQTPMHPDDIHKTAVTTPFGTYEWCMMLMGSQNCPSIHQHQVTNALYPFIGKICHTYLDDRDCLRPCYQCLYLKIPKLASLLVESHFEPCQAISALQSSHSPPGEFLTGEYMLFGSLRLLKTLLSVLVVENPRIGLINSRITL